MRGSCRNGNHDVRGHVDNFKARRLFVQQASVVCTLSVCVHLESAVSCDSCGGGRPVRCPVPAIVAAKDQSLRHGHKPVVSGVVPTTMLKHRFDQTDFSRAGAVDRKGERNPLAVHHRHDLGTLAALRIPYAAAPFFALANIPSARAVFQSSSPNPSNSRRHRCQAFWKTPDFDHVCNLRQHVGYDGNDFGKSFHRAPDRSTHTIPSKQGLGGTWGRPPARVGAVQGNKSSITDHCSSVSSVGGSILDAMSYRRVDGHHTNVNCMIRVSFQPDLNATPLPVCTVCCPF